MVAVIVLLVLAVAALTLSNMHLYNRAVVARRVKDQLERTIDIERKATASLIRLASEETSTGSGEIPFLDRYCDFTRRTIRATGVGAFLLEEDEFRGAAVCGIFPPLEDLPPQLREQLVSNPRHHRRHIQKTALSASEPELERLRHSLSAQLYTDKFPSWIPVESLDGLNSLIISPITAKRTVLGMVMVVQHSENAPLAEADADYALRLGEIAGMCIDGMRVSVERIEQEQRLRMAHEEGMLQVTTGMVHNIGNAVTVAQLITSRLLSTHDQAVGQVADFLVNDLLPALREHREHGDLVSFLGESPEGAEYLTAMDQLLPLMVEQREQSLEQLRALDQKLLHITEIIDLQQHFVGELGTEELVQVEKPIGNAITIVTESAELRHVQVHTEFGETPRILADATMMTQIFLNLLTNSIEALGTDRTDGEIKIRTYVEREGDAEYVVCSIADNGPGIPQELQESVFESGTSTKKQESSGVTKNKGLGLNFCRQTVNKYNGSIRLESKPGQGTTVFVRLPA